MGEEEAAAGSWDTTLDEWLIAEGFCCAAALMQQEDGAIYAAAPAADEAGWGFVYAEDHEQEIMQDDGVTTKKVTINEATNMKECAAGTRPKTGLWVAGTKYQICQQTSEEVGDNTAKCAFAKAGAKKGLYLVQTTSQIILAMYDEEKEQTAGNCKKSILAFAEYMMGEGY